MTTRSKSKKATSQHLPMSSFLENQQHLTSTPEKNPVKYNGERNNKNFNGDITLYESPVKMSPIKFCPLSPTNSCISNDSCNDIRLFEDIENHHHPIGTKGYGQKLKHDYSGRKRLRKLLFTKEKPANAAPKKAKRQLIESKQLEDWASNVNADFAEIDQYELIIE